MADVSRWRRLLEPVLTLGEYPGEPESRRSGRRVFLVAFVIATAFTLPQAVMDIAAGYTTVGVMNLVSAALTLPLLISMKVWPLRFAALVQRADMSVAPEISRRYARDVRSRDPMRPRVLRSRSSGSG